MYIGDSDGNSAIAVTLIQTTNKTTKTNKNNTTMKKTLRDLYKEGIRKVTVKDIFDGLTMEMILKDPIYTWCLHTEDGKWWAPREDVTITEIDGEYVIVANILRDEEVLYWFS